MTLRELCAAIVSQLNDPENTWSLEFTAARGYVPSFTLKQLSTLAVVVVPHSFSTERNDETGWRTMPAVDIGILKKLPLKSGDDSFADNPNFDPLIDLVSELIAFFQSDGYHGVAEYDVHSITSVPIYDREAMIQERQFTAVLTVTFLAVEDWEG